MRRPEHPLIVALVESYAEQIRVPRAELWAALDGQPSRPELVRGLVEAFEPLVRESDFAVAGGLPRPRKRATLDTMHTSEIDRPRIGPPLKHKHPLMLALAKAGVTAVDEAKNIRRSVASLRSFCFPRDSVAWRPIPRSIAERWLKVYGVPLSAWPRISD